MMIAKKNDNEWDLVIEPKSSFFRLNFREIWNYKDLILLFTKRDIISQYKQTILGPFWLVIQPILATVFFTIIFGGFAKFDTGIIPYPIFTLSGLTIWNFFSSTINKTSTVFVSNASIFGKVYFPRLTVPVSIVISNTLSFFIQFAVFILLVLYFMFFKNYQWNINLVAIGFLPLLLFVVGIFGMGCGLIISSLTTKYRDLTFLVSFALQFLMYFSAVVFPIDTFNSNIRMILNLNPLLHIVKIFRSVFVSTPLPDTKWILYSCIFSFVVFIFGILIFNRIEKSFMDTV